MLTVTTCAAPGPLLARMVEELAATADPWARHWLILPGAGASTWVQRRWARRTGIAARSQVVDLRSLVEQAAAAGRPPFSPERLALAVAAALPSVAADLPLPRGIDTRILDARTLAWARQLADALDLGLLCRDPEACLGAAPFLRRLAEDATVQAALAGHLGRMAPDAFASAVRTWMAAWAQRQGGLPHLWILLDAGQPRVLMRCLVQLLELLPPAQVHLGMCDPGDMYWGDLRTGRRRGEGDDAGPVLRSFGRCAQDLHNQMIDLVLGEGGGDRRLELPEPGDALLGRLQACCRSASAPAPLQPLAEGDRSLTVHACRSPLRELEVCRDRIVQELAADPTLRPDDILLLLADPERLAPLVGAALQPQVPRPGEEGGASAAADPALAAAAARAAGQRVQLPFRLVGSGLSTPSPLAEALRRVLEALRGRLDLAAVQGLVEEPLIAERFGLDRAQDDGQDLMGWLVDAGFRWGLDPGHRAAAQGPGETRWNLAFALRRLGLGAVVAEDRRDAIVAGTVPLDRASGLATAALAGLAALLQRLEAVRADWAPGARRGVAAWCALVRGLCADFLGEGGRREAEHRTALLNQALPALERAAPPGLELLADAFLRLLEPRLADLAEGQGEGGGIAVGDLRLLAGTPARMVLVAGLGAEHFPRREERPAWHPLASGRQPGDPDRRDADRHALLQALLACGDRLVLTYLGGSDADARPRPPSTPVADLLAAIDQVAAPAADGRPAQAAVHHVHGLNGCSPSACAAAAPAAARSALAIDALGAELLNRPHHRPYPGPWSWTLPPEDGPQVLAVDDLLAVLEEPCRLFTRRLGLRLPEQEEALPAGDLLRPDGLAAWGLRDALLRARLAGDDVAALRRRLEAAGDLPRGRYGEEVWQEVSASTPAPEGGPWTVLDGAIAVELAVDGVAHRIEGRLPAGWHRSAGGAVMHATASTVAARHALRIRAGLLLLARTQGVRSAALWSNGEPKPEAWSIPDAADLDAALAMLVRLHGLARRLALPFWPEPAKLMRKAAAREEDAAGIGASGHDAWTDEQQAGGAPPPCRLPATRACFRGCPDPFAWTPDLAIPWLPEPAAPLAWRLVLGLAGWERALGGKP